MLQLLTYTQQQFTRNILAACCRENVAKQHHCLHADLFENLFVSVPLFEGTATRAEEMSVVNGKRGDSVVVRRVQGDGGILGEREGVAHIH